MPTSACADSAQETCNLDDQQADGSIGRQNTEKLLPVSDTQPPQAAPDTTAPLVQRQGSADSVVTARGSSASTPPPTAPASTTIITLTTSGATTVPVHQKAPRDNAAKAATLSMAALDSRAHVSKSVCNSPTMEYVHNASVNAATAQQKANAWLGRSNSDTAAMHHSTGSLHLVSRNHGRSSSNVELGTDMATTLVLLDLQNEALRAENEGLRDKFQEMSKAAAKTSQNLHSAAAAQAAAPDGSN